MDTDNDRLVKLIAKHVKCSLRGQRDEGARCVRGLSGARLWSGSWRLWRYNALAVTKARAIGKI
jgi:hypothetical protein